MTHKDAGNYAAKRRGAQLNEKIAARLREKVSENRISCAEAHSIATELSVSPAEVGTTIDLLEIRIIKCQLGLFGHGKEKSIPTPPETIRPEIESAIRSSLENGRLSCFNAWEIAKKFDMPRPLVAATCEALKVKISPCQLGAFG